MRVPVKQRICDPISAECRQPSAAGVVRQHPLEQCDYALCFFRLKRNGVPDCGRKNGAAAAAVWMRDLKDWTFWDHLRTIASAAASALFVVALAAR